MNYGTLALDKDILVYGMRDSRGFAEGRGR